MAKKGPKPGSHCLDILKEQKTLSLRELTKLSARKVRGNMFYADVAEIMENHLEHGQVTVKRDKMNYVDDVWSIA